MKQLNIPYCNTNKSHILTDQTQLTVESSFFGDERSVWNKSRAGAKISLGAALSPLHCFSPYIHSFHSFS